MPLDLARAALAAICLPCLALRARRLAAICLCLAAWAALAALCLCRVALARLLLVARCRFRAAVVRRAAACRCRPPTRALLVPVALFNLCLVILRQGPRGVLQLNQGSLLVLRVR